MLSGALNPLEQLRGYLAEHHERSKDNEYRNGPEQRRLHAEAALAEIEAESAQLDVIGKRFDLAVRVFGLEEARRLAAEGLLKFGDVRDGTKVLSEVPEVITDHSGDATEEGV